MCDVGAEDIRGIHAKVNGTEGDRALEPTIKRAFDTKRGVT